MGFSGTQELENWIVSELGNLDVLEGPVKTPAGWQRVRPVESIYHICAGNVAVSAETSLLICILLGSKAVFKLPSSGLPELEARVKRLPQEWQQQIELLSEHDPERMRSCDAVVVFGSDQTVASVTSACRPQQRVLRYGNKISMGVVTATGATEAWARAAVQEILAYQQLGCLSPQSYLCEDPGAVAVFAGLLEEAFQELPTEQEGISLEAKALIFDARQRNTANGDTVCVPRAEATWTVVQRRKSRLTPGPGFGFIEVVPSPAAELPGMLETWRGKLSSVSFSTEKITSEEWAFWEDYGVHRLCRMGNLQRPPIAWTHDGRPRLADLVSWTYADPDLNLG